MSDPTVMTTRQLMARSGRLAYMARADLNSPWVQVGAIRGQPGDLTTRRFLGDLDGDEAVRRELIADCAGKDWGEDAP